jgi:hypothetical protein
MVCWLQIIVQNLAHQKKIIPYVSTQPWRMGENRQGKIGKENKHLQKPKVLQKESTLHILQWFAMLHPVIQKQ